MQFLIGKVTRTCTTTQETTGLARVEESTDLLQMVEGMMAIQSEQTDWMLPWLLPLILLSS